MYRRELGWWALGALVPSIGERPSVARADQTSPRLRFALRVHIGRSAESEPVIDPGRLARWVAAASEPFADAGIAFRVGRTEPLPAGSDVLRTIRDRRALARHLAPRRINVFVVRTILDPTPSAATRRAAAHQSFEPSGRLAGAHIPVPRRRPGTYILVMAHTSPLTLSHELGHFFGAGHHPDPDNIMSYGATRSAFSARQLRVFRHFARRYVRRGHLRSESA